MFIIAFPSDSLNTIKNTIKYAINLNTTYAQFSIWTPYPGTPVYEDYKKKIIKKNYESFDQYSLVYKHNKFDSEQVRKFLDGAYTQYYSRLGWLTKYLKSFFYA